MIGQGSQCLRTFKIRTKNLRHLEIDELGKFTAGEIGSK